MLIVVLQLVVLVLNWNAGVTEAQQQSLDTMTLFDFNNTNEARWQIVNDGVMGGRSKGQFVIDEGKLVFTGTLVTRGGGFTSVRTNGRINLEGYDGVELRVRGGGRTFDVAVGDDARLRGRNISRRAPFQTGAEWTWVRVPFSTLGKTIFGRRVNAPDINLATVNRIGFFIADGIDGPFQLEVDEIRVYKEK